MRCVRASGTLFMFAPTSSPEEPDAVWDVLCPLRALTTTNRRDSFGSPPLKFTLSNSFSLYDGSVWISVLLCCT